jgi:hypothetical protein
MTVKKSSSKSERDNNRYEVIAGALFGESFSVCYTSHDL